MGRPRQPPSIKALFRAKGRVAWRVLGTIAGKQKKKICRSKEEAELVAYQWATAQESDLRVLPTRLTPKQVREAEAAVLLLDQVGVGLAEAARWLAAHYERPSEAKWASTIAEYAALRQEVGVSPAQVTNVVKAAKRLASFVHREVLGDLSRSEIEAFLRDALPAAAPATFNGLLGDVRTFCRWAVGHRFLRADPTEGIERRRVPHRLPPVLRPEAAEALLRDVEANEPEWIPYLGFCLFAALRPGTREGEAERLHESLRTGRFVLHEGAFEVQGKANGTRLVPWAMTGPLRLWLDRYPARSGLWPVDSGAKAERRWAVVRARHGLSPDVLRHTAISAMCYGPGASLAQVSAAAGNSESIIRRHYLGRWSTGDTARLWAIKPTGKGHAVNFPIHMVRRGDVAVWDAAQAKAGDNEISATAGPSRAAI